jgi:uncharacterized protein YoxC
MDNDDYLRSLIGEFSDYYFNANPAHLPRYSVKEMAITAIVCLVIAVIFVVLGITSRKKDSWSGSLVSQSILYGFAFVAFGIFVIAGLGAIIQNAHYDEIVAEVRKEHEVYEAQVQAFEEERERTVQRQKQYTVYLDGVEIEYNKVHLADYKVYVDDSQQAIYLTH